MDYAALMAEGVQFPPIKIWYDSTSYWLSDGFHRLAAARRQGSRTISAIIQQGSLIDARWDSYRANSEHGLRRTKRDLETVVARALKHPNAAKLSNVEIAKHLNMAEATLRRWRKRLSSSSDEDATRLVTRGERTYVLDTARIGKARPPHPRKSLKTLGLELAEMKQRGSPDACRLLSVVTKWASGGANAEHCLRAIEQIVAELKRGSSHNERRLETSQQ